ncbi:MAG: hypothetical protein IIA88_06275, partial [Bacteroidetes bacterium]|nr:hypothetical protein [Bacteroidota bacterium]
MMSKIIRYVVIIFLALFFSYTTYAQPPNNTCSGSEPVPLDGTCTAGTTVGATDNWVGTVGCQSGNNHPEVWYIFTADSTTIIINITAGTLTGDIEFILVQAADTCSGLTLHNSSCGPSVLTDTITGLQVGALYHFTISSSTGSEGTFDVCITSFSPPVEPGQDCQDAHLLCDTSGFSVGTVDDGAGIIFGNGSEEDMSVIASCFGQDERQSQWYTFTVNQTGTIEFNINLDDPNDDYDWVLYDVSTSGCALNTGSAPEIACNWSGCKGSTGITSDDPA